LFDERADALLDELVRIVFPQNMKSMETYYRWLALQYAAQRGRIHHRLVETLFRYNARPTMSGFLYRLEELTNPRAAVGLPAKHEFKTKIERAKQEIASGVYSRTRQPSRSGR
jgi:hypothetical protein